MEKKIISIIILILIIGMPLNIIADGIKSIVIVVDELHMDAVKNLATDNSNIGLINLKTRKEDSEESLYWSINLGRKVDQVNLENMEGLSLLGDVMKNEKLSYIGEGKEWIILSDSKGRVNYEKNHISYDFDWLVNNTNNALEKSNLLVIGYDFEDKLDRIDILKEYLNYYNANQIIILPKSVSNKEKHILNKFLVPIIYNNNNKRGGLLTSSSTNRLGIIALEDISVQLKNSHGFFNKIDIGSEFKTIDTNNPIEKINKIYENTINLLVIAYVFHGLTYLFQVILGLYILKFEQINKSIFLLYVFSSVSICMSILFGLIGFYKNNILIYLFTIILISYLISKIILNKKGESLENLIIYIYILISFGTLVYPEMIYNSYIGFNNLIYGARYYGLNNGIMGVLLASSILTYLILIKRSNNVNLNKLIGVIIFGLNMIISSTSFGSNTGGFITSIILFVLMMDNIFFIKKGKLKKILIILFITILIFSINIYLDSKSINKSHAIEFFSRLKENGFKEFTYMASFKAKELLLLTIRLPFSIVLICQGIILKKLSPSFIRNNIVKNEVPIIIIVSLIGFIINDTGVIMIIYMINFYIIYIINSYIELK